MNEAQKFLQLIQPATLDNIKLAIKSTSPFGLENALLEIVGQQQSEAILLQDTTNFFELKMHTSKSFSIKVGDKQTKCKSLKTVAKVLREYTIQPYAKICIENKFDADRYTEFEIELDKLLTVPNQYNSNPLVCETPAENLQNIEHLLNSFQIACLTDSLFLNELAISSLNTMKANLAHNIMDMIAHNTWFAIFTANKSYDILPLSDWELEEIEYAKQNIKF